MSTICRTGWPVLFALALLAAPAMAQEPAAPAPVSQTGSSLHIDALGHRLTVPLPDWLTSAERLSPDVLGLVESTYYADPAQAFVEFFPAGQSLDDWHVTYAARLALEPGRSLEDYRRATIFGYSQTCRPELTGAFLFGEERADFFPALGFVCGAFADSVESLRGQGEILVAVFKKTATGIAMVSQEWKGPAFDPSDPSTWPVDREALQARADQLQAETELLLRPD